MGVMEELIAHRGFVRALAARLMRNVDLAPAMCVVQVVPRLIENGLMSLSLIHLPKGI